MPRPEIAWSEARRGAAVDVDVAPVLRAQPTACFAERRAEEDGRVVLESVQVEVKIQLREGVARAVDEHQRLLAVDAVSLGVETRVQGVGGDVRRAVVVGPRLRDGGGHGGAPSWRAFHSGRGRRRAERRPRVLEQHDPERERDSPQQRLPSALASSAHGWLWPFSESDHALIEQSVQDPQRLEAGHAADVEQGLDAGFAVDQGQQEAGSMIS